MILAIPPEAREAGAPAGLAPSRDGGLGPLPVVGERTVDGVRWRVLHDEVPAEPSAVEAWWRSRLELLAAPTDEARQLWWPGVRAGHPVRAWLATGPGLHVHVPTLATRPAAWHDVRSEVAGEGAAACLLVRGSRMASVAERAWPLLAALLAGPEPVEVSLHAEGRCLAVALRTASSTAASLAERHDAVGRATALGSRADATRLLARRIAEGGSLAVALADLDKTQCINDVYGRALTEEVVRRIFDRAREVAARAGALAFVYLSGDELGVIGEPGTTPAALEELLRRMQAAFDQARPGLRVLTAVDTSEDELGRIAAADPRIVAAALHGEPGHANLLVHAPDDEPPERLRAGLSERLARALGRPVALVHHWFAGGCFRVPSFTAGGVWLPPDEVEALRGPGVDPFATVLAKAGLMCRLAKRRRGSVRLATSEAELRERVSVFPPPRPVHRPGVVLPPIPPPDAGVDAVTGLARQDTLELELLPETFATGDGAYLEISDVSYASPLFVEEEHKRIKWGPVHDGAVIGARIMAINEFYGYEAGNDSVRLVGANARAQLPPAWQGARLARKSPDKLQILLPRRPSVDEVLDYLDALQEAHARTLSEELSVRLRAVLIPLALEPSVARVLDDVEPLRLMDREVEIHVSPRERSARGTGNVLVAYAIARDDAAGRLRFEQAYRAVQAREARRAAQEIEQATGATSGGES